MVLMEKRNYAIDYAKTIAIYLVIAGHLLEISSGPYNFIYSFHMPLFFFLSGILFNVNYRINERVAISFNKLLVPYLWFCLISFLSRPFIFLLLDIHNLSFNPRQSIIVGFNRGNVWRFSQFKFSNIEWCFVVFTLFVFDPSIL